ncbi:MAG: FAD:protein FMN transferase ApbE [Pirellula sp.]|nr:FAD:protein FMN transferase ApbE [Pirellula sp.]
MWRTITIALPVACAALTTLLAAAEPDEAIRGRAMGTGYTVKLADRAAEVERGELARAVQDELERLEQIFSLYREQSELSRWNAAPAGDWLVVSDDLFRVARQALQLAEETDGAFDPTVAPLVRLWRMNEATADWRPPTPAAVRATLASVGRRHLELRPAPPAIRKRRAGVELDLNAVVEGYAIDRLVELLQAAGVRGALVELGGEFRAFGRRGDGRPWRVGIEDPRRPASLYAVVDLVDGALATSGDYRQALVYEGVRYAHLLDPRTGSPITHSGTAVSVLADDALTADGWATALMILGPDAGRKLAEQRGLAASFVRRAPPEAVPERTGAASDRIILLSKP